MGGFRVVAASVELPPLAEALRAALPSATTPDAIICIGLPPPAKRREIEADHPGLPLVVWGCAPWPERAWRILPTIEDVELVVFDDPEVFSRLGAPSLGLLVDRADVPAALAEVAARLGQSRGWRPCEGATSDDITVFVSTVGAPSFPACLDYLAGQDEPFELRIIDRVAPMSAAFQRMLDECRTPLFVQVDEDMLLYPSALRTLKAGLQGAPANVAFAIRWLFDVHLGQPILGVKVFRHELVSRYPLRDVESCEVDQYRRMEADGLEILRPGEDEEAVGLHGTHFTAESAFERYRTLERKLRRFPAGRPSYPMVPEGFLQRFWDEGDEVALHALMGCLVGRLEPLEGPGQEKDYRAYSALPALPELRALLRAARTGRAP